MKEYKKKSKNAKGITLIALVVTVVILLILAGITINVLMGENSIFAQAQAAGFKTKMAAYRDKVNLYVAWRVAEDQNTDINTIHSGEILKELIQEEFINDIKVEDVSIPIKDIIDDIGKKEEDYVVVYKGEIYYVSTGRVKDNKRQVQWCREIGIKILDYTPATGMDVVDGSYEKVNDMYLCTPVINTGLVKEKTRYIVFNEKGKMTPGDWVIDRPQENWYDYSAGKWANIYVENNGVDSYFVWIPRYCFTLDQSGQRSDVKLIDTGNNYKDAENNTITWEELEAQGYQIPDAFTFDGKAIPGYWAMKYTVNDIPEKTKPILYYDMSVEAGVVKIDNIVLDTTVTDINPIVKYTVALNGRIIETITDVNNIGSKVVQFRNLREGDNTINVTGLNANGEIVGSMTKEHNIAPVNKPVFEGFDKYSTFYVTYDKDGNEVSDRPISEPFPEGWYDYGSSSWANIVTRNNNQEIYYTWIPRYQFKLEQGAEKATIEFVAKTDGANKPGYQVPDAFTFDGKPLTGFWAMKYTVGDETAPLFDTEVIATNSTIRTKGITGTAVAAGQKYVYYLDGVYKGTKTSAADEFEFTGLTAKKEYTMYIEVKDSSNKHVGFVTKKVKTIEANKPNLKGFDKSKNKIYYVLYDAEGKNATIGDEITIDSNGNPSNSPANWYNYSQSKWANIVVTDGTVSNGQITGAKNTTYFVWIPRYEFRLESGQYLQTPNARASVRFIEGTGTATSKGYQIPDAFTFNSVPLTGYWAMKYTAQSLN